MAGAGVLVVEDDADMAEVLRLGLEHAGYDVHHASDGAAALNAAGERTFAAIVLDVMLPVLDGLGVADALRRRGSATPILMLTARLQRRRPSPLPSVSQLCAGQVESPPSSGGCCPRFRGWPPRVD